MKRRIRLTIGYDGSGYNGWQRQHHSRTIQGELETCLARICGHDVTVHGAGRTDAGVHALAMVAHFQTSAGHPLDAFFKGMNSLLPPDIRILKADEVTEDFHSRFSALGKTYRYHVRTTDVMPPTERLYCAHFPGPFDLDAVRRCLPHITGCHDFSSFEATGSRDKTVTGGKGAVRTLFFADCRPDMHDPASRYVFSFTGDGFLRHMVRNLVGTLMLAARGRISEKEFLEIIASRNRARAGATAAACGLFLVRIHYTRQELDEVLP